MVQVSALVHSTDSFFWAGLVEEQAVDGVRQQNIDEQVGVVMVKVLKNNKTPCVQNNSWQIGTQQSEIWSCTDLRLCTRRQNAGGMIAQPKK